MKVWRIVSYILLLLLVLYASSITSQAAEKGIIFVGESHISIASASVTPSQGGDNTLADYALDNTLFLYSRTAVMLVSRNGWKIRHLVLSGVSLTRMRVSGNGQ